MFLEDYDGMVWEECMIFFVMAKKRENDLR